MPGLPIGSVQCSTFGSPTRNAEPRTAKRVRRMTNSAFSVPSDEPKLKNHFVVHNTCWISLHRKGVHHKYEGIMYRKLIAIAIFIVLPAVSVQPHRHEAQSATSRLGWP